MFRYLDRYDEALDFKPWLRKIAINACLQYLKKYKTSFKTVELTNDFEKAEALPPVDLNRDQLYDMINQLPRAYRIVFNLSVIEEYKHHEIAELLNISVGTSKSNLSRAKHKISEIIKKANLGPPNKEIANG
jgi:RNA polymerase sigma-70 factor (ECF subfamily)